MNKFCLSLAIALIGSVGLAANSDAIPFPNPAPTTFADDLDDLGIFFPSDLVVTFEIFDLGALAPAFAGNTFGFFFVTDPANLITIFDPLDQDPDPSTPDDKQIGVVNFLTGTVIDWDELTVQDTFSGIGNIGFFLTPDASFGLPTLFTVPSLNPLGLDFSGTFPRLGVPENFLLSFAVQNQLTGQPINLGFEFVAGISPVSEPATLILLASGLLGFARFRRKSKAS